MRIAGQEISCMNQNACHGNGSFELTSRNNQPIVTLRVRDVRAEMSRSGLEVAWRHSLASTRVFRCPRNDVMPQGY